jgi:hypothetical protein
VNILDIQILELVSMVTFYTFVEHPLLGNQSQEKGVTISSTEAEYFALSEVAQEVIFVKQLVASMGITIAFPISIKVDNVGAI